jgi:hypothetical protein
MNVRPVAFLLLALPSAWSAALVLANLNRTELPATLTCFAIGAGLGAYSAVRTTYPGLEVAGILGGLTAIAVGTGVSGTWGADTGVGLLLALPWILTGYVARTDGSLGLRFVAFGGAVAGGLVALAARSDLALTAGALRTSVFLNAVVTVVGDQSQVLSGLVNGTALPALPLLEFFDPVYAGLTAAAALGLCLATVRPQTGDGVLLPLAIPLRQEKQGTRSLPGVYGFTARQRTIFADRSEPEPPLIPWPPGLVSVVAGAVGGGVFLYVAYAAPFGAVLGLTLGLVVASATAVVLTEFPGILRLPRRRPRRTRAILVGAQTPRVTKELLTSPSLPVPEPPPPPPPSNA